MSYGIIVSKSGYSATSGSLADKNKIFDSSLNHLKTAVAGSFEETVGNGSTSTVYVTHSLGYYPLSMCYFTDDNTTYYKINMSYDPSIGGSRQSVSDINVSMYCDTSKTYFEIHNYSGASRDITVEYEIFYEGT